MPKDSEDTLLPREEALETVFHKLISGESKCSGTQYISSQVRQYSITAFPMCYVM